MFQLSSELVLLVGEGNFSFSCSLLKKNEAFNAMRLFATSFESKDLCLKKYANNGVFENLSILGAKGAHVFHGVDATKLSEAECCKTKFDLIIFQFPHIGRKASIKQNRDLLRKFFLSARECLHHNGSVIVTLCAGQGGTPSDVVQREYCNSWQIVEMAGESDFVLTEVDEFDALMFPGYTSTGRRNHGNSFSTLRAMSHRFKSAKVSPSLTKDWRCFSETTLENPLPSAIQSRAQLLVENPETIPCYWISKEICKRIGYKEHFMGPEILITTFQQWMRAPQKKKNCCKLPCFLDHMLSNSLLKDSLKNSQTNAVFHGSSLHPTLSESGTISMFQHHMLFISMLSSDQLISNLSNILSEFCDNSFQLELQKPVCGRQLAHKDLENDTVGIMSNSGMRIRGKRGSSEEPFALGYVVHVNTKPSVSILLIDAVDLIKAVNQSLHDPRVLWSLDALSRNRVIEALKSKTRYVPISLHPPTYMHDVSFWVKNTGCDKIVSEIGLVMVIFLTADDTILSLKLVDEYEAPGRKSYCYRIVYHCHDSALSRQNCLKLQAEVRKNTSTFLDVIMR